MSDVSNLPAWVWDMVIRLQRHEEEHPQFFQLNINGEYVRPSTCGCEPLQHVPDSVRHAAYAIAEDRQRREGDD